MYRQLTQEKRYTLYVLRQEGYSLRKVANRIGVHVSTVSIELKRNVSRRGYRPGSPPSNGFQKVDTKVSIDEHPDIVDRKCRVGDWE